MRSRDYDEKSHNHERWLVSYADFITLLFALFVVMYAISSVNEGKYRVLSETLRDNFRSEPRVISAAPRPVAARPGVPEVSPERAGPDRLNVVAERLRSALGALLDQGQVTLERTDRGVELSINSRLLFATGSSALAPTYQSVLEDIARVLAATDHRIDVEGFTDDRPISTRRFPSNWELSAARAAAVVRSLAGNGIDPASMAAVGYGPHHPIADNDDPAGRARNRRVVLLVRDAPAGGHGSTGT